MTSSSHHILVVIAGGSASGKSTLGEALCSVLAARQPWLSAHQPGLSVRQPGLSARLLSTDAYFLPLDRVPRFLSPSRGVELPDYNHPDSLDLPRLLADLDGLASQPDCPDVLVLEGLMVLHYEQIRSRLDLRLFVELDADQRALRRLVRNIGHQYDPIGDDHSPAAIATYFLECAKVGHEKYVEPSRRYADLILRGDGDFARTAQILARSVLSLLPG